MRPKAQQPGGEQGSADGFDDACRPGWSRASAASESRITCGLAGDVPFPTEKRIA
jgi:hypothetical protein